jgi:molybdopterin synthase catalytic subunit
MRQIIERWVKEIKGNSDFKDLGMILIHNGMVRATSKDGRTVKRMRLSYNEEKLNRLLAELSRRDGVVAVKVWINEGLLKTGDDIMYALVAGRFRTSVIPVLEELISRIKKEIVLEEEIF